jgi:hypothetical protein
MNQTLPDQYKPLPTAKGFPISSAIFDEMTSNQLGLALKSQSISQHKSMKEAPEQTLCNQNPDRQVDAN